MVGLVCWVFVCFVVFLVFCMFGVLFILFGFLVKICLLCFCSIEMEGGNINLEKLKSLLLMKLQKAVLE